MKQDNALGSIEDVQDYTEQLILFTQAQHMPVVQATVIIATDLNMKLASDTIVTTIQESHLGVTHKIESNLMPDGRAINFREFMVTITRR